MVHQTEWQRKMLHRYGDELVLLDATYKTTRYTLPLFFLCVQTNVCYSVVAYFITEEETSSAITEAIEVLKGWNEAWQPKQCMVDFCEAEINALQALFPGNNTLNIKSHT